MISKISHISIYVLDQDSAYDFYVNKLGFEVKTDAKMDNGFRWLTVAPKEQGDPDIEIVLMPTINPMADKDDMEALRGLVKKGVLGAGVYTLWALDLGCTVVAVEPIAELVEQLRGNLALNAYRADVHRAALHNAT